MFFFRAGNPTREILLPLSLSRLAYLPMPVGGMVSRTHWHHVRSPRKHLPRTTDPHQKWNVARFHADDLKRGYSQQVSQSDGGNQGQECIYLKYSWEKSTITACNEWENVVELNLKSRKVILVDVEGRTAVTRKKSILSCN